MRNPEESVRQFVDQRYPSVVISETELKKDYGKQIAEGDVDPSSLSFNEWLFNQMEETGGTLSHYTPPEPELPEFSILLRETFVLRTKVKAKSYLEAMRQRKRFPQVVIFVRDGRVEEVYSSNPDICVDVADYDFDYDDPDRDAALRELEERAQQPDMHLIYE